MSVLSSNQSQITYNTLKNNIRESIVELFKTSTIGNDNTCIFDDFIPTEQYDECPMIMGMSVEKNGDILVLVGTEDGTEDGMITEEQNLFQYDVNITIEILKVMEQTQPVIKD